MAKIICGIYCIENRKNEKKYIGQSKDIFARLDGHKSELKHNKHESKHLQRSYNKNGLNSFCFYILEDCIPDAEILDNMEKYYIALYNTTNPKFGYNHEPGGNKPPNPKGRKATPEQRKARSEATKGKNHPMFNKHHKEESKAKMSASKKGKCGGPRKPWSEESRKNHMKARETMNYDYTSKNRTDSISNSLLGGKRKYSLSKYMGLSWDKTHNKWHVTITYNKKRISLGSYIDEIQAAKVFDKKSWELYQRFDLLNFPEDYEGEE